MLLLGHHGLMRSKGTTIPQANLDAERDRMVQVLALEYNTLREEMLLRLTARYQFFGFITAAAALVGVAIGYSSGIKVWLLAALAAIVVLAALYGHIQMVKNNRIISARVMEIEERINQIVPAAPGTPNLLRWETEHQHRPFLKFKVSPPTIS